MPSKPISTSTKIPVHHEAVPPIFDNNLGDDFFFDIDSAFEQIQMNSAPTEKTKTERKTKKSMQADVGMQQMRNTYRELVQLNLSPVARYLKAFEFGVNTKDLTQIAQWVVTPLITQAKNIGLDVETNALNTFKKILARVNKTEGTRLTDQETQEVIQAFGSVSDTFDLYFRGHSTAVVNLIFFYRCLKRKPTCTNVDLRKFFSIGIPSMSMIRKISLAELMSLTGLSEEKASWIRTQARTFTMYDFV